LSVNGGTEPQKYKDGAILFALKKPSTRPMGTGTTAFNTATVSLLKIKRLTARAIGQTQPLYQEVEDIQLEFYANQTSRFVQINTIREGEERAINVQSFSFGKPKDDEMLVLIANIEQLPLTSAKKDTRFNVYRKSNNFGNGTQKLFVTKSYWTKPQKLPGGGMSKPYEVKVNAYELTVQINIDNGQTTAKN